MPVLEYLHLELIVRDAEPRGAAAVQVAVDGVLHREGLAGQLQPDGQAAGQLRWTSREPVPLTGPAFTLPELKARLEHAVRAVSRTAQLDLDARPKAA